MITISENSKETVSRLIRREFDTCTRFWMKDRAKELIETAKEYQLLDLAQEMESDMEVEVSRFLS